MGTAKKLASLQFAIESKFIRFLKSFLRIEEELREFNFIKVKLEIEIDECDVLLDHPRKFKCESYGDYIVTKKSVTD
jgi:hypothetical protein